MKNSIGIVGAGQIGSRHLQALTNTSLDIWVADISVSSLEVARSRFYSTLVTKEYAGTIHFVLSISEFPPVLDVVIIASTASIRRKLVEEVLEKCKVKYMILEKVLFQKVKDIQDVFDLLQVKGVVAYVNFPRRMFTHYQKIKNLIGSNPIELKMEVLGGNWGMACNSLHFIDLFYFLTDNEHKYKLDASGLEHNIVSSKRNNYIEVFGVLTGYDERNNSFSISCEDQNTETLAVTVIIHTPTMQITIVEVGDSAGITVTAEKNSSDIQSIPFELKYQSELTDKIISQLLKTGECQLTPYEKAGHIHRPFLEVILNHYNKSTDQNSKICPIT